MIIPTNEYQEYNGGQKKRVSFKLVFFLLVLLFIGFMVWQLSQAIDQFQTKIETRQAAIDELINLNN